MNRAPLFPDRPNQWLARGTYRDGGLRGQSCSASVYTRNRGRASALELATESFPWMRVDTVALIHGTESDA